MSDKKDTHEPDCVDCDKNEKNIQPGTDVNVGDPIPVESQKEKNAIWKEVDNG